MALCFLQAPGIAWDEFDGEAVLVDPAGGKVWRLNPTASYIWKQCRAGTQSERIIEALANGAFDTDRTKSEIASFLGEMETRGLVKKEAQLSGATETQPPQVVKAPKLPYVAPRIVSEEVLGRPSHPVSPNSVTKLPP